MASGVGTSGSGRHGGRFGNFGIGKLQLTDLKVWYYALAIEEKQLLTVRHSGIVPDSLPAKLHGIVRMLPGKRIQRRQNHFSKFLSFECGARRNLGGRPQGIAQESGRRHMETADVLERQPDALACYEDLEPRADSRIAVFDRVERLAVQDARP